MNRLDETHEPALRSWVFSANDPASDFPIQNLPLGVFRRAYSAEPFRCGVAIGDFVLDVSAAATLCNSRALGPALACAKPDLNQLMALGPEGSIALRQQLSFWLREECDRTTRKIVEKYLIPRSDVEMGMPARVGGFTDFFASIDHATNAGRLFRPDQPLLPNYKHVPVAYNGRANSVRLSGVPVTRPRGQIKTAGRDDPEFIPSARLDYEVEIGIFIGKSTTLGRPLRVDEAWEHVFGACLLNDWSARDIQSWEYQPLGPFLAKSFATSVSPWIVTAQALAPYRVAARKREATDPSPLSYLTDSDDAETGGLSIAIDASILTEKMRSSGLPSTRLSRSNSSTLYWTVAQMLTHHTSNGSALDTGDLLGSGTISGPSSEALGSLLEISVGGSRPLALGNGESRTFLQDGDEIVFTAACEREGFARIGFGECRAVIGACPPAVG